MPFVDPPTSLSASSIWEIRPMYGNEPSAATDGSLPPRRLAKILSPPLTLLSGEAARGKLDSNLAKSAARPPSRSAMY
jgi:hypothetical protein